MHEAQNNRVGNHLLCAVTLSFEQGSGRFNGFFEIAEAECADVAGGLNEAVRRAHLRGLAVQFHREILLVVDEQRPDLRVGGLATLEVLDPEIFDSERNLDDSLGIGAHFGLGDLDILNAHPADIPDALGEAPVVEVEPVHPAAAAQAAHRDVLDRLGDAQQAEEGVGVLGIKVLNEKGSVPRIDAFLKI